MRDLINLGWDAFRSSLTAIGSDVRNLAFSIAVLLVAAVCIWFRKGFAEVKDHIVKNVFLTLAAPICIFSLVFAWHLGYLQKVKEATTAASSVLAGATQSKEEPNGKPSQGRQPSINPTLPRQTSVSPAHVVEMEEMLHSVFVRRKNVVLVLTSPKDSEEYRENLFALLRGACQREPRGDCTREPTPDPEVDLDFKIPKPIHRGTVIHTSAEPESQKLAAELIQFLSPCMLVRKSTEMPDSIKRLDPTPTRNSLLVWFQMDSGSPWKEECSR